MKLRSAAAVAATCAVLIVTASTATAAPAVDDVTAPEFVTGSAGYWIRTQPTMTFTYEFRDPGTDEEPASGVAAYDVRYQERKVTEQTPGDWILPTAWQNTTATSVAHTGERGIETCFQVRARDQAGNESAWSWSHCSEFDGTAPTFLASNTSGRVSTYATYSIWFSDNSASDPWYDVAYRDQVPGQPRGPWVYPDYWREHKSNNYYWDSTPGVDRCLMARARDYVGNISGWTTESCVLAPWDDRAFTSTGTVSRVLEPSNYRGTNTTLKSNGASLVKTGQVGKQIALVATHGPGQGVVDVYHAGVKLGRVSLAATSTEYQKITYLPVGPQRTGEVKVVSVSTAPATIDGVGVIKL